jgi:FecR protein
MQLRLCLNHYNAGLHNPVCRGPLIGILKMHFRCCAFVVLSCVAAGLAAPSAFANETRVGKAVVIQNNVVRLAGETTSPVVVGDSMLRDEVVRTGTDSAARFVMADSTNLSLGPSATIKLDRTVFNDEHSYRDIAIQLTAGAFRFVTGHSEKAAYKITTPLATIGVRGTILDILSQRGRTSVVLQEGAASVCTLSFQCIQLTQAGDTAVITVTGGKTTIHSTHGSNNSGSNNSGSNNGSAWNFAGTCALAAGFCAISTYADASPAIRPPVDDGGILCGR